MNHYVTDTHALFWYLTRSSRLGINALNSFTEGVHGQAWIYIPAIVIAELYFLNEKYGRPVDFLASVDQLRNSSQFIFVPFNAEDTLEFGRDAAVPEMHDRIIVGVTRRFDAICISRDSKIIDSSACKTIW
ncbi:MAG: PIN domain-containing protein [Blastocatellia bacterium]